MIYFILGLISGLIISVMVVTALTFFRRSIEKRINIVSTALENAGSRPKGYIVEPGDESEELRKKIVERNKKQGKDTPLEDLR